MEPTASKDVVEKGARWHDAPRDAARNCEIVITCLLLPHDVFDNMTGEKGASAGYGHRGACGSTRQLPTTHTIETARLAAAIGVHSLEAPVATCSTWGSILPMSASSSASHRRALRGRIANHESRLPPCRRQRSGPVIQTTDEPTLLRCSRLDVPFASPLLGRDLRAPDTTIRKIDIVVLGPFWRIVLSHSHPAMDPVSGQARQIEGYAPCAPGIGVARKSEVSTLRYRQSRTLGEQL
ncbi:NAD(P)-binding domain-containing protein [Mesorhizobium sophorae]|uniref:NAD(P)-binding domain-containing protein n=1 Tax=Mesorhizobium sophorae TaxID=1300294 RepID=UPI003CC93E3B